MPADTNPPAPIADNFEIQRGIDMPERQYQAIGENNVPLDLTGYTLEAEARQQASDPNGISFDLNPEFVNESQGIYRFPPITGENTYLLTEGEYHYDVVMIDSDGVRYQPAHIGQIDIVAINTHLP